MSLNRSSNKMNLWHMGITKFNSLLMLILFSSLVFAEMPDFYSEPGKNPFRGNDAQTEFESVDPFTGKLQLHHTDVFIPGNGGLDLKVLRSYTSGSYGTVGELGSDGWSTHFGYVTSGPAVAQVSNKLNPVLVLADGSAQVLSDAGGGYLSTQFWKAAKAGNGGLIVTSPEGTVYSMTFPALTTVGQRFYAEKITDKNGNSITISYTNRNGNGAHVSSVSTSDGRSLTYSYNTDANGYQTLAYIDTPSGRISYSYSPVYSGGQPVVGAYMLTEVNRPGEPSWTYGYNNENATAGAYSINKVTTPTGATTTYTYGKIIFYPAVGAPVNHVVTAKNVSGLGNWTYSYHPGGTFYISDDFDENLDWTEVTEPTRTVKYAHYGARAAANGEAWKIGLLRAKTIDPRGSNSIIYGESYTWAPIQISSQNNSRNYSWLTLYDTGVNAPVIATKTIHQNGGVFKTTYQDFDAYGNPAKIIEKGTDERTITRTYDLDTDKWLLHQLKTETIDTYLTSYTYDGKGNIATQNKLGVQTSFTYTGEGDVFSITDARGKTTTFQSYFRGIPKSENYPDGSTITRNVNPTGTIASETDGLGNTVSYTYDALNRPTSIDRPLGNDVSIGWSPTTRSLARGNFSEITTYDVHHRPMSIVRKDLTTGKTISVTMSHDAQGNKTFESLPGSTSGTSYSYDAYGQVLATVFADGNSTSNSYNGADSTIQDEAGYRHSYHYRVFGNPADKQLMAVITPKRYTNDAFNASAGDLTITRNSIGQPITITQNGIQRSYDYSGPFLTSESNPETGITSYVRDGIGNMTSRQVGINPATTYTYDAMSRISEINYPGTAPKVAYRYDNAGQIITATSGTGATAIVRNNTYDANKNLKSEKLSLDGRNYQATYTYNANDVLNSITYPSGQKVTYSVNAFGNQTAATPFASAVTYNTIQQPEAVLLANGVKTSYTYNSRQWPNAMNIAKASLALASSAYSYDVKGNLSSVVDIVEPAYNRTFKYDWDNRLVGADGVWGVGNINYDKQGNITFQNFGTYSLTHQYDTNNRLTKVLGSKTINLTYDSYGNVTNNGTANFKYDDASNLRCVNCDKTNKVKYDYDAQNLRVKKSVGSTATYYFYGLNGSLLSEHTPASQTQKDYFYLGAKLLAEQEKTSLPAPSITYYHNDIVGSPIAATDKSGALVWREHYKPYGDRNKKDLKAAKDTRWFTGKPQDAESGLSYFGARYYDPLLGRFMGMDPVGVNESNVHSHNRYAYGNNNPYRFVDPDGNNPIDVVFLAADIVKFGTAVYSGVGIGAAAIDVAISAASLASPVPGVGQAYKAVRLADKAAEVSIAAKSAKNMKLLCADCGFIYKVEGSKTKSGLPYIGSSDFFDSQRKFFKKDGRDRTDAEIFDFYPKGDVAARKAAEERAIIWHGGISNLDNLRNEISPSKWGKFGIGLE